MRPPARRLALSLAALLAASSAMAQELVLDDSGRLVEADEIEDVSAPPPTPVAPSPDRIEATVADPYPVVDAVSPEDPAVPDDLLAPLEPGVAPAPVRLRPSSNEVAPLGVVVRPAEAVRPALPLTGPIPAERDPEADARAEYEPIGLRFGRFDVNASTRTAIGYSTNSSGSAGGEGSAYARTEAEVVARSDWERHGLDVTLRGGFRRFFSGDTGYEPDADVIVNGRIDLTEVDRIGTSAAWRLRRETADSGEIGTTATGADIHTLTGSIGYERSAGLIGVALNGAVDRTIYELGTDRTNTALSSSLRLSLDSGAVLEPFVEAGVFTRRYDRERDGNGFARSSVGAELKGGLSLETGLVSGELAAGYAVERPEDGALPDLRGVLVEASIAWTPTRLTTVTLTGDTVFEPSQIDSASGSVQRSLDLDVAYALRPDIVLDAGAGLSFQDYFGVSREVVTTQLRAGVTWQVNRTVGLGLTATHEITDSTVAGEDSTETTIEAAVTLRR